MTNLTQSTQIINITPKRISADHYQIQSFTKTNRTYDQYFNYELKRWDCTCPDFEKNYNTNCKHNILLRAYIKQASTEQPAPATEQHHSNSTELISILTRIVKLENAMGDAETSIINAEKGQMLIERDLEEHKYQLDTRSEQERILRQQLAQQQKQIDQLMQLTKQQAETIEINRANHFAVILETSKIVEQQQEQIEKLLAALDQQGNMIQELELQRAEMKRMLDETIMDHQRLRKEFALADLHRYKEIKQLRKETEDQAQKIDRLHDQLESQARPAEQIVRVVVEAPAARSKRESDEPKAMEIKEVRNEQGKLVACKVGRFTVKVSGTCAGNCDCSTGIMDRRCPHIAKVDEYLSK